MDIHPDLLTLQFQQGRAEFDSMLDFDRYLEQLGINFTEYRKEREKRRDA